MAFTAIKRAVMNARFHKINKHYKTDPVVGERSIIQREGKDPVEVLFYYPKQRENMPVFVQIHGGAWVGLDAVDDDRYCQRLSEELGAFVVNVNYKRLYDKSFPYPQEDRPRQDHSFRRQRGRTPHGRLRHPAGTAGNTGRGADHGGALPGLHAHDPHRLPGG